MKGHDLGDRLGLGRQDEDVAAQYLQRKLMKTLERNLRTPVGEIDLIACYRNITTFDEVKTRMGAALGSSGEVVELHKQRKIIRTAKRSLNDSLHVKLQHRFDVVSITAHGDDLQIE